MDEWLALNRHVELALWQFGIFAFKAEIGFAHFTIPYNSDAEALLRTPEMHRFLKSAEAQLAIETLSLEARLEIAKAISEPGVAAACGRRQALNHYRGLGGPRSVVGLMADS